MPFKKVKELEPDPAVRVFFSGQLILQPFEGNKCKVFVNRTAPDHHLSIEVRLKQPHKPDELLMRHLGPLHFVRLEEGTLKPVFGFLIEVSRPAGPEKLVTAYVGDGSSTEDESLNHAVDLVKYHPGLEVSDDEAGGRPAILLDDGTLYTAARTDPSVEVVLTKPGQDPQTLPPVASLLAANIYLPKEEANPSDPSHVTVHWRVNGILKSLAMMKPAEGSSFEIYISNDPLFSELPLGVTHEELHDYYRILPGVDTSERCKLEFSLKDDGRGSTRTPCMPVVNDNP